MTLYWGTETRVIEESQQPHCEVSMVSISSLGGRCEATLAGTICGGYWGLAVQLKHSQVLGW